MLIRVLFFWHLIWWGAFVEAGKNSKPDKKRGLDGEQSSQPEDRRRREDYHRENDPRRGRLDQLRSVNPRREGGNSHERDNHLRMHDPRRFEDGAAFCHLCRKSMCTEFFSCRRCLEQTCHLCFGHGDGSISTDLTCMLCIKPKNHLGETMTNEQVYRRCRNRRKLIKEEVARLRARRADWHRRWTHRYVHHTFSQPLRDKIFEFGMARSIRMVTRILDLAGILKGPVTHRHDSLMYTVRLTRDREIPDDHVKFSWFLTSMAALAARQKSDRTQLSMAELAATLPDQISYTWSISIVVWQAFIHALTGNGPKNQGQSWGWPYGGWSNRRYGQWNNNGGGNGSSSIQMSELLELRREKEKQEREKESEAQASSIAGKISEALCGVKKDKKAKEGGGSKTMSFLGQLGKVMTTKTEKRKKKRRDSSESDSSETETSSESSSRGKDDDRKKKKRK